MGLTHCYKTTVFFTLILLLTRVINLSSKFERFRVNGYHGTDGQIMRNTGAFYREGPHNKSQHFIRRRSPYENSQRSPYVKSKVKIIKNSHTFKNSTSARAEPNIMASRIDRTDFAFHDVRAMVHACYVALKFTCLGLLLIPSTCCFRSSVFITLSRFFYTFVTLLYSNITRVTVIIMKHPE